MKNVMALMQREWLQHRMAWGLMAVVPALLAVLLLTFGQVQIDPDDVGEHLPVAMALAALGGGMGLYLVMLWIVAVITTAGFARRDHGDRSVEFWLSLPTGHGESLGVPLLVHLVLVPIAAILAGAAGGLVASFVLVTRVDGVGAWFALPWGGLFVGAAAIFARLAAGVIMATLWLSPLLLLMVLLTAWFRRWGLVILALALGVGTQVLDHAFGIGGPARILAMILVNAGKSVANAHQGGMVIEEPVDVVGALQLIPSWALGDIGHAMRLLASPVLVGGLVVAAICFALLVRWRQRGAESGG